MRKNRQKIKQGCMIYCVICVQQDEGLVTVQRQRMETLLPPFGPFEDGKQDIVIQSTHLAPLPQQINVIPKMDPKLVGSTHTHTHTHTGCSIMGKIIITIILVNIQITIIQTIIFCIYSACLSQKKRCN